MKSPSENDENAEKYIKPNRKWEKKKKYCRTGKLSVERVRE